MALRKRCASIRLALIGVNEWQILLQEIHSHKKKEDVIDVLSLRNSLVIHLNITKEFLFMWSCHCYLSKPGACVRERLKEFLAQVLSKWHKFSYESELTVVVKISQG